MIDSTPVSPKVSLDSLESHHKRNLLAQPGSPVDRRLLVRAFIAGIVFSPFLLVVGMFIAIFGQILILMALALGIRLSWVKRSFKLPLSFIVGACVSLGGVALLSLASTEYVIRLLYPAMLLGMVFTITFIFLLAAELFRHRHQQLVNSAS